MSVRIRGDSGASEQELMIARAYLSAVAEPPAPALTRFIAEHGPVRSADMVFRGRIPAAVNEEVGSRSAHCGGQQLLDSAAESGIILVTPEDEHWPYERFSSLSEATSIGFDGVCEPVALWARGTGSLRAATANSISIVGARAASGYGEATAAELGYGLAAAGLSVVSGAAYGIDGAAHRGALAAGGTTIAFLACGVDIDYPAGHSRLLDAITEHGVVASEYPPGTRPRKHRFLVRNRLIAAAGFGTVVVEAGARSGASNTANTSDSLGRPVMAVPGPVTAASSVGCHAMIRSSQAVLVTNTDEVLEVVNPMGKVPATEAVSVARRTDTLDQGARQVHDALGKDGTSVEHLAADTGLAIRKVRALLPALEMAGLAVFAEHGWRRT